MEANAQRTERPASSWQRQGQESLAALTRREPLRAWASTTTDLPWGDPAFSERMLHEHLDQSHDLASRRLAVVEQQVTWLVEQLGLSAGDRVLDLACGPGLYAAELGRRGCRGDRHRRLPGSDPRGPSALRGPSLRLHLRGHALDRPRGWLLRRGADPLRTARRSIARRRRGPPRPGPCGRSRGVGGSSWRWRTHAMLDRSSTSTWWTGANDLWGAGEHLVLHERGWDGDAEAVVDRFHVVDLASGRVEVFGVSERVYPPERLATVLAAAGFSPPAVHPAWDGISPDALGDWVLAVAEPHGLTPSPPRRRRSHLTRPGRSRRPRGSWTVTPRRSSPRRAHRRGVSR